MMEKKRKMMRVAVGITGLAVVLSACQTSGQVADVSGQGGSEPMLASGAAEIERMDDGVRIIVSVPTPEPGSYEYPTADMALGGATHPEVVIAEVGEAEVFTLWGFVFNHPENCTDDTCDADDIGDTPAKGGVFQVDAVITDGDKLNFEGGIRLGENAGNGIALENPHGAEIHAGIAPHGKALSGQDLYDQLNVAVGNPTLWWAATFPAP